MPRGNGTGPNGMGPMTGRQAGYCAGYGNAGWESQGAGVNSGNGNGFGGGRGLGRGFGAGRGFSGGRGFGAGRGFAQGLFQGGNVNQMAQTPATPEEEKFALNARAHSLSIELENIKKRLEKIEE